MYGDQHLDKLYIKTQHNIINLLDVIDQIENGFRVLGLDNFSRLGYEIKTPKLEMRFNSKMV